MNDLMIHVELIIVGLIGLIGFIFNWLLILAIQRKTYYYQQHQRLHQITGTGTTPVTTPFITHSSISTLNGLQQAAVEGGAHIQSTKTSTLDKFILSLLINDIFVCNFLIPLHLIDLSSGLPCDFLCYTSKFIEKLSTVIELVIITLLIITSFFYFSKKRFKSLKHQPAIERICFCSIILLLPLVGIYIAGTFSVTANEQQYLKINRSSCQKTYVYIQESTQTTLNWLCFIFTYLIASFDLILLIKIKLSIKNWTLRNVKNVSRHGEQSYSENSYPMHSISSDMRSRTLLNYYDFHQAQATPPNRSPPLDYSNYINISEFAGDIHTLGNSTFLLLFLYVLSYVPYWTHETSGQESLTTSSILSLIQNDLYLFTHAIKPLCYLITQKKLRSHIWAILQYENHE